MHVIVLLLSFLLSINACENVLSNSEEETGDEIAFRLGDAIYVLNLDTGHRRKIIEPGYGRIRWSFDGEMIAYTGPSQSYGTLSTQIYVADADGNNRRVVTLMEYQGQILEHIDGGFDPVWSPDGMRIAFARGLNTELGGDNYEIFIIELDTTTGVRETRITDNPYYDSPSDWSPDGQNILFRSDYAINGTFDDYGDWYTFNLKDGSKNLVFECNSSFSGGCLRYSPNGQFIAFLAERDNNSEIYIMNSDGSNIQQITDNNLNETNNLSWSLDGSQILFLAGSPFSGGHIYIINVDGSGLKKITGGEASYFWPEWRPMNNTK